MSALDGPVRQSPTDQSAGSPIPTGEPFTLPPAASQLEGVLRLRDGSTVRVRAIRPDDTPGLRAFHAQLSRATILLRFFHYIPDLSTREADRFTHVDYATRMALVATVRMDEPEHIVGIAGYDAIGPAEAEVSFVVADRWQGRGIASALLPRLATYARAQGFTTLVAITMVSNIRMLDVLRHCGYPASVCVRDDDAEIHLDISVLPPAAPVLAPLTFMPDDSAPRANC
jgi:GNAT superfamily N-acetyltransferase